MLVPVVPLCLPLRGPCPRVAPLLLGARFAPENERNTYIYFTTLRGRQLGGNVRLTISDCPLTPETPVFNLR